MDEELNRAIDAALEDLRSVKPSPDFLPRLRAHVERAPRAERINWWLPLAASAATIAAGVIAAAVLSRQPSATAPPTSLPSRTPSNDDRIAVVDRPTVANLRSGIHIRKSVRNPQSAIRNAVSSSEPEVLVPASARAAIVRLVEALNAGDERARGAVLRLGAPAQIPQEIVVEPIRIDPVVVPPMKESS